MSWTIVHAGQPSSFAPIILFQMKCPICKKTIEWEDNVYRPFCSRRCQLIDLGNWASEKYTLPSENELDGKEDENGIHDE